MLLGRQIGAFARLEDERARGPCGIVEDGLVPGARRIMDVDAPRRRLERREAVIIVERVEQPQMEDGRQAALLVEAER